MEKNAHKKGIDGPLQPIEKKQVAPRQPAAGAKAEVKKEPKTEFKMNTYYIVASVIFNKCFRKTMGRRCSSMRLTSSSQTMLSLSSSARTPLCL